MLFQQQCSDGRAHENGKRSDISYSTVQSFIALINSVGCVTSLLRISRTSRNYRTREAMPKWLS